MVKRTPQYLAKWVQALQEGNFAIMQAFQETKWNGNRFSVNLSLRLRKVWSTFKRPWSENSCVNSNLLSWWRQDFLQSKVRNRRAKRATRSKVGSTGSDALPDATLKSQVRIIAASIQFQSCLCIRMDKVAEFPNKTWVRDEKAELTKYEYTVSGNFPSTFSDLFILISYFFRLFFWQTVTEFQASRTAPSDPWSSELAPK